MRELSKVNIDGVDYVFTPLSPTMGAKLLPKIMKSIGGPVSKLLVGMDMKKGLEQEVDEKFATALGEFFVSVGEHLDEQTLDVLMDRLLKAPALNANGKQIMSIDSHFSNYPTTHLFKVLKQALEVNYGDFLEGLVAKIKS